MPDLTVPYAIPYVCQFASRDLVHAFLNEGRDVSTDPHWREYGADSPEEYAHWALRACGVVCVKMAVDGLTGQPSGTVMEWVRAGLALDGYLVERRPDRPDKRVEKGWKHAALAQLANEAGCQARLAADLSMDDLAAEIMAGHVLIASVSSELGEEVPITRRSGHLVVVYGVGLDDGGQVSEVILHNPSGRRPELQAAARIQGGQFRDGFSGRGIVIGLKP